MIAHDSSFVGAQLDRSDLSGAQLTGSNLSYASMFECVAHGIQADACIAKALIASHLQARDANFSGLRGDDSVWTDALLAGASFKNALMQRSTWGGAMVTKAILPTRMDPAILATMGTPLADIETFQAWGKLPSEIEAELQAQLALAAKQGPRQQVLPRGF